jgi:hypothetical protein
MEYAQWLCDRSHILALIPVRQCVCATYLHTNGFASKSTGENATNENRLSAC